MGEPPSLVPMQVPQGVRRGPIPSLKPLTKRLPPGGRGQPVEQPSTGLAGSPRRWGHLQPMGPEKTSGWPQILKVSQTRPHLAHLRHVRAREVPQPLALPLGPQITADSGVDPGPRTNSFPLGSLLLRSQGELAPPAHPTLRRWVAREGLRMGVSPAAPVSTEPRAGAGEERVSQPGGARL